jgi:hypothetical protein
MTWSEMTSLTGSFVKSAAWEEGGKKTGEEEVKRRVTKTRD